MIDPFMPYQLGSIRLANRIVMAPMTRSRAYGTVPSDLHVDYYAQRATAGLIISEGSQPSVIGQGYPDTPGLHSATQVDGWRRRCGSATAGASRTRNPKAAAPVV